MLSIHRVAVPALLFLAAGFQRVEAAWDDDRLEIIDKVTAARDRATELKDAHGDGKGMLTGRMNDTIDEAVEELEFGLKEFRNLAERDSFLGPKPYCDTGSECDRFRQELIKIVRASQDLGNGVLDASPASARIDLDRLVTFLEKVPGISLYPLWIALAKTTDLTGGNLVDLMQDAVADVAEVKAALDATTTRRIWEGELVDCDYIHEHDVALFRASESLQGAGLALVLFGKFATGAGEMNAFPKSAGLWGWVSVHDHSNKIKLTGTWLETLGIGVTALADRIGGRMSDCEASGRHQAVVDQLTGVEDQLTGVKDQLTAHDDGVVALLDGPGGVMERLGRIETDHGAKLDLLLANQALLLANQADIRAAIQGVRDQMAVNQAELLQAIAEVGPPWGGGSGKK
jgi:hypothetical protein